MIREPRTEVAIGYDFCGTSLSRHAGWSWVTQMGNVRLIAFFPPPDGMRIWQTEMLDALLKFNAQEFLPCFFLFFFFFAFPLTVPPGRFVGLISRRFQQIPISYRTVSRGRWELMSAGFAKVIRDFNLFLLTLIIDKTVFDWIKYL